MRIPMQNTIHFVLQAKGGIGKSFVSTLLAQYLLNETGAVRCFDTDQENTTFTHYEALNVRHVPVANSSRLIEPKKFDGLMETLLTEEGNFVIDTGANTFSNLLAYMVENEVFPMLAEAGKTTYVHTIVGGVETLYRRNAATYGEDIRKLNTKRHTVAQALASSDYSLMEKQRIKTFSRDVFGQLGTLNW